MWGITKDGLYSVVQYRIGGGLDGNDVARHLAKSAFPRPFTTVIHYSGQAALARAAGTASSGSRVRFLSSSCSRRRKRC